MMRLIFLVALLLPSVAWGNSYYTHGSFPAAGSIATSAGMRAELDLITAGFDKLPDPAGNANKIVVVNGSGSGLTTTSGTLTIPDSFTITGAYGLTLGLTGTTSLSLPTSGTVATLAGTENLSSKTLVSPLITGSVGLGAAINTQAQLHMAGTFAPGAGSYGTALNLRTTITAVAGQDANGAVIFPVINEAASGTHGYITSLEVDPPTIGAGSASVTNAITLRVAGTPTAGTNNYALYVDNGTVRTDGGNLIVGVAGTGGGTNPHLILNNGSWDSYVEMTGGVLRLSNLTHIDFAPGQSDKARLTSNGIMLVGSTDTTALVPGGLGLTGGLRMAETSTPSTPASNNLVLYAADDGSGNTVLAVAFPTGNPVTLARENVGVTPPGTVAMWAKSSAAPPSGWLMADGAAVSRTTYATLFASISTTFGSGDGSTTFNVPTIADYATNIRFIIKC